MPLREPRLDWPDVAKQYLQAYAQGLSTPQNQHATTEPRGPVFPSVDMNLPLSSTFTFDPNHCLFTPHRRAMYYAYLEGGVAGLAERIYELAAKQKEEDRPAWSVLLQDGAGSKVAAQLLKQIHPEVLTGLICGNLTWKMKNLWPSSGSLGTTQSHTPGVYCIQWNDTGFQRKFEYGMGKSPLRTHAQHKGFSIKQLQHLYDLAGIYATLDDDHAASFANEVELLYDIANEVPEDHYNYRMYLQTPEDRAALQTWRATLKEQVLDPATQEPDKQDESCIWSPLVIGAAHDCDSWPTYHTINMQASNLFKLLNAIIFLEFPEFEKAQYQLMYITKREHAKLGQAICSVLASSHRSFGGMEPQLFRDAYPDQDTEDRCSDDCYGKNTERSRLRWVKKGHKIVASVEEKDE